MWGERCLARGEWVFRGRVNILGLALPILWEHGKCGTCVCVWVAVV